MILAVDCGSTNLKGALFTPDLKIQSAASVPVPYLRLDAERAELDPDALWLAFLRLVNDVAHAVALDPARIAVVAMGSQAQTFTLLDAHGRPRMPFLSWLDNRARAEAEEWRQQIGNDFHRHCSFPHPLPALQLSLLLWVRRHRPDVWRQAARLVTLPGYLAWRLSRIHALDDNLAAMQGLYSMVHRSWRSEILDRLELPRDWLPSLVRCGERLIPSSRAGDSPWLGWRPAIVLAGNDHTVGAVGNEDGTPHVLTTFGTALVAYHRPGPEPGPYHPAGIWGPYPGGGYYELGVWGEGGAAVDWACARLCPGKEASTLDAWAASVPPSDDVLFFPERARGVLAWLGAGSREKRARAVLEGILYALRRLLDRDLEIPPDRPLTAIGGGSRSTVWMQMAADVTGRPVRIGQGDALLGAAVLASGETRPPSLPAGPVFQPDPERQALYERIFARWLAAWMAAQ
jgi:sugar (pentulose or hexulose) kinase